MLGRDHEQVLTLQPLDDRVVHVRQHRPPVAAAVRVVQRLVGRKARERVGAAEGPGVGQVGDQPARLVLARNLGQQRPEGRDRLDLELLAVAVEVVVDRVLVVPHERLHARLQGEVLALVAEGDLLVVQRVGDRRDERRARRLLRVEVHRIGGAVAGTVAHAQRLAWNRQQAVVPPIIGLDPLVVAFQDRQHLAQAPLGAKAVVQVVLRPREQGRLHAVRVRLDQERLSVRQAVFTVYGPARLLLGVERVELRLHGKLPVRVHEREGGAAGGHLAHPVLRRIAEDPIEAASRPAPAPIAGHQLPGGIEQVHQRLVVVDEAGKLLPGGVHDRCLLRNCYAGDDWCLHEKRAGSLTNDHSTSRRFPVKAERGRDRVRNY